MAGKLRNRAARGSGEEEEEQEGIEAMRGMRRKGERAVGVLYYDTWFVSWTDGFREGD
jgi:hypothetical protein